jgi:predicted metal-dependent hydrolase
LKIHPHLLARDLLAGIFVRAASGNPGADSVLEELERWSQGGGPGPGLLGLRTEDGAALFAAGGELAGAFGPLAPYLRDRAQRFVAARGWIREAAAEGDALECALAAWDAGLFFEVHELLEPAWTAERGPERDLLEGLIMAAVALHHLCDGNRAGAQDLLHASARKLAAAPAARGLDLERFARDLEALGAQIAAGRIETAADVEHVPRLERLSREGAGGLW